MIQRFLKYRYTPLFSIVVLILSWYLLYNVFIWFMTESTDNAYLDADISIVSAEINGPIKEVLVRENTIVAAGDVIARIDDTEYKALYEKAISEAEAARYEVSAIEKKITLAELERQKAVESFEFSETNLKISQADFYRTTELKKENYASKKLLDSSEKAFEQAKNELSQAKLSLTMASENLLLLEVQKQTALTRIAILEQAKLIAKRALDNTFLKAPISGMIGNSSLRKGNYVRAGIPLFSVVPIHDIYLEANFKETQIANFTPDMEARFTVDSISSYEFIGKIRNISPATGAKFSLLPPANATGNFTKIVQRVPVIIDFDIPEQYVGKLVPGMSCIVKIRAD